MKVDIVIANTFQNQPKDIIVGTYLHCKPRYDGDDPDVLVRKMWKDTHNDHIIIECTDRSCAFGKHVTKGDFEFGRVTIEPELISIHALYLMVGEQVDMEAGYHFEWQDYKIIDLKKIDDPDRYWCGGKVEFWMRLISQYPVRHISGCYISRNDNGVLHLAFPG